MGAAEYWGPAPSRDGSTLILSGNNAIGVSELLVSTRSGRGTVYSLPEPLASINSNDRRGTPFLSANGLTLYYYSVQETGLGARDIYSARRSSTTATFASEEILAGVNSPDSELLPSLTADERTLAFVSPRPGGSGDADLWLSTRTSRELDFGPPQNLLAINSAVKDESPALSSDGLLLLFVSDRPGGAGGRDVWQSERASLDDTFGDPALVSVLNTPDDEREIGLSADDQELFFVVSINSTKRLWRSLRTCD